ncbi:MFS transporter [Saccharopolyspora shandongensis]|uniref:MFS transporter n=1 Tax=Saccharopolyspora shandongensis TaxID=418495 RepID=UPI00343F124A
MTPHDGEAALPTRRIALASFAGTTIEFYDFFIYGTAAALVFPKVFFPALGTAAGTIASLASVAVAFVARPLGSALFGHLGDRLGRKRTLVYTLLLMGLSTVAIGVLPGSATLGIAAPIILMVLRFLQGVAVGGEWGGAALLAVEYAPPGKHGRFGMFPQLGPGTAFGLSSATFLAVELALSPDAFLAWGWRLPFLLSALLVGIGLYVRLRIEETPVFRELHAERERRIQDAAPLRAAFGRDTRLILLAGGTVAAAFALNYMGTVYLTTYGSTVLAIPRPTMLTLGVVGGIVLAAATAAGAAASDRFGRRRVVLVGNVVTLVCGLIAFPVIDTANTALVGIGLCLLMIGGGIVLGPAAAYLAELFATGHRYTAAGMSYNVATIIGGGVPPVLAAGLVAAYGSNAIGVMLGVYGVLSIACGLLLPETKERSLRRIDAPADALAQQ